MVPISTSCLSATMCERRKISWSRWRQPSADGNIAPLDARLRPDGEKGPMICSLDAYKSIIEVRAQFWELQRFDPGPSDFADRCKRVPGDGAKRSGREPVNAKILFGQIDAMLERIRRDRGGGSDFLEFKTGTRRDCRSGISRSGAANAKRIWNPEFECRARRFDSTRSPVGLEEQASKRYDFLRRCESVLRRQENKSISTLCPLNEREQARSRAIA